MASLVIFSASRCTTSRSGQLSAPLILTLTRPWLLFSSRVTPRLIQPNPGWAVYDGCMPSTKYRGLSAFACAINGRSVSLANCSCTAASAPGLRRDTFRLLVDEIQPLQQLGHGVR